METIIQKFYRIEHSIDKKGMFHTKYQNWSKNEKLFSSIVENFYKINNMFYEFQNEISYDDLFHYKCGFKDIHQFVYVMDFEVLDLLSKFGFEFVEIKADVIVGETQVIFKDENLKRRKLTVNCIKKQLAKLKAKQDLKEEFKTLNIENYIVLN